MGPGKTGLAGSLHKPLPAPGGKGEKVAAGYYSPASLGRGGGQQGAKARPLSQQGNGPHLPEGSRAARDSVGWEVQAPGLPHSGAALFAPSGQKCRVPRWLQFSNHTALRSAASNFLQRQGSYSRPEAACLPEGTTLPKATEASKGSGFFFFFLEPSSHPNPIKNHLGASELPQASPKVS